MNAWLHVSPLFVVDAHVEALAPIDTLGFVLQLSSAGAILGGLLALRGRRRGWSIDPWQVTTAWSALGVVIALVVLLVTAVA